EVEMLKPILFSLLGLILSSAAVLPQNQGDSTNSGFEIWNAWNTTPQDQLTKSAWPLGMHTSVPTTLLLYRNGDTFGGRAIVDTYPGFGDVMDGRIDDNNISFTVIAHPVVNNQIVDRTIYYNGKINGDQMDLTMRWPMNSGGSQVVLE